MLYYLKIYFDSQVFHLSGVLAKNYYLSFLKKGKKKNIRVTCDNNILNSYIRWNVKKNSREKY